MEEPRFPKFLNDFCSHFQINFFDLCLPCIFCRCTLNPQELAGFYMKKLSLVWKEGRVFACCTKCLLLSAQYEKEHFFQCVASSGALEHLTKKTLSDICVRCIYCLTLLDLAEKVDIKNRELTYSLVRGHWRGVCRNCIFKE
jgi:hypothetical protein